MTEEVQALGSNHIIHESPNIMSINQQQKKRVTQKDIAIAADVSIATVSMALAGSAKIPEATKEMILNVAKRIGYQILQKNKSRYQKIEHNIGLLVDTNNSNAHVWNFLRVMIESLSKEVQLRDSTFVVLPVSPFQSKDDILKMVMRSGVSGVVSFIYADESVLIELEAQGIPVVLTFNEQRPDGFFYVGHDDFQGGYEATIYLLKLQHRHIAYVYTKRNNQPFLQSNRFVGFKKALNEWDIPIKDNHIINYTPSKIDNFKEEILQILDSDDAPTAFLCLDDNVAASLIHILDKAQYNIPEDISIIAHGDSLDYSDPRNPQITTMCMDLELSSSICCNILFNRFEDPHKSYSSIKTRELLINRGSCAKNKSK